MESDDYDDGRFTWRKIKAAENIANHKGVTFEEARKVFDDPFALEFEDTTERYDEPRFVTIGVAGARMLYVVHTPRKDRTRIISARVAEAAERRRYHEANRRW